MLENAFNNDRYKQILFDQSKNAITTVDLSGRINNPNETICSLFGYTREEFQKLTFDQITVAEYLPLDRKHFQEMLDGRIDHYNMIKAYRTKYGLTFMADLDVYAIRNIKKEIIEIVGVVRPHRNISNSIWSFLAKNTKIIVKILYTILTGSLIILVKKWFNWDISWLY